MSSTPRPSPNSPPQLTADSDTNGFRPPCVPVAEARDCLDDRAMTFADGVLKRRAFGPASTKSLTMGERRRPDRCRLLRPTFWLQGRNG
jgi:hypothetical protein